MIGPGRWGRHRSEGRDVARVAVVGGGGAGAFAGQAVMALLALSLRLGWSPSYPTFDRSSLAIADEAAAAGTDPVSYAVEELKSGRMRFAVENPEAEENFPRVLTLWRSNLFGSSAKGDRKSTRLNSSHVSISY